MRVIEQMLSRYAREEGHHALREVMQEIENSENRDTP